MSIELGSSTSRVLRRLMRLSLYEPVRLEWQPERTSQLLSLLDSALSCSDDKADNLFCSDARMTAFRTVSKAREYVEAHLNQPLSMPQLAAFCAVSLSKLERSFRKEIGLTPTQYVLARRLHAARRELQQISTAEGQVAKVATDFGFYHLGRFAGVYRRHFGELPSETLST